MHAFEYNKQTNALYGMRNQFSSTFSKTNAVTGGLTTSPWKRPWRTHLSDSIVLSVLVDMANNFPLSRGCKTCAPAGHLYLLLRNDIYGARRFHSMQFQPLTISTYCIFNLPQFRPIINLAN